MNFKKGRNKHEHAFFENNKTPEITVLTLLMAGIRVKNREGIRMTSRLFSILFMKAQILKINLRYILTYLEHANII